MLTTRLAKVENVAYNNSSCRAMPIGVRQTCMSAPKECVPPIIWQDNLYIQRRKEPRMSMLEKFDRRRFKFRRFINQIQLITILQRERYLAEESKIELVGTLLT